MSDALDLQGYGDLLQGQLVDMRDALVQMQIAECAERLRQVLAEADAMAAQ